MMMLRRVACVNCETVGNTFGLNLARPPLVKEVLCGVLNAMVPQIQCAESQVTERKIDCVPAARNRQRTQEHAKPGGFPADRVSEVQARIDATSAE